MNKLLLKENRLYLFIVIALAFGALVSAISVVEVFFVSNSKSEVTMSPATDGQIVEELPPSLEAKKGVTPTPVLE